MSETRPRITDTTSDDFAQARMDAQDESIILPLREYLVTHGCAVTVNDMPPSDLQYWIVVGDEQYVKEIAANTPMPHVNTLHIILGVYEVVLPKTKTVLMDPVSLMDAQVKEIFAFFFTGKNALLDLRGEKRERPQQSNKVTIQQNDNSTKQQDVELREPMDLEKHSQRETHLAAAVEEQQKRGEDTDRIKRLMADVYAKPAPPVKKRHRVAHAIEAKIGVMVCLFLLAPCVWYLLSFVLAPVSLAYGGKLLRDNNATGSQQLIAAGRYWVKQGTLLLDVVKVPLQVVGMETTVRHQERLWSLYENVATVEEDAGELATTGKTLAQALFAGGTASTQTASKLVNVQTQVSSLHTRVGLIEAEVRSLAMAGVLPFGAPFIQPQVSQGIATLGTIRTSLNMMEKFLSLYPRFAGFDRPKTYLVLLQNSMEVRPTGGFIGSVGIAKFEDGRLTDFTIQDVYDADGQLKGHVDPPPAIRDLLAQEHWYLRDSNMNPNFPESGARAAWFYEKEMGVTPDGVVAVSLPVVVDLLRATGPIELGDYGDRITAENFLGKAIFYTKSDFFPGSTQKKDFLGSLARALVLKITEGKTSPFALFTALSSGFTGHDIQFYFAERELEELVTEYGWAGAVPAGGACESPGEAHCMSAPLSIAEANLSVNKESYFITRNWERTVSITQEGSVSEDVRLVYKNPVDHDPYTMYLTVTFPKDSAVDDVRIGAVSVARRDITMKHPAPPYVEKLDSVSGLFTIGIALTVPPGAETAVSIQFSRAGHLTFGGDGAMLDLFTQKQAGLSDIGLTTTVRYPVFWLATEEGEQGRQFKSATRSIAKDGQFQYNTVLSRDSATRLHFQQ